MRRRWAVAHQDEKGEKHRKGPLTGDMVRLSSAYGGINVFAELDVDLRIDYPVLDTIRSYVNDNGGTQSRAPPSESGGVKNSAEPNADELQAIQNIGRKSVNDFSSSEIETVRKYAERYWREMGVKSPFFRAWFGDWRVNDKTALQIANRKGSDRGLQHNEDTGWDINVSAKVFNETKVQAASYTRAAITYLQYINDIVNKAVLLDSYTIGKAKSSNSLMMHSLYAVADAGDGAVILKLYVEEMNDPNSKSTSKRAYQLQNIEKYQHTTKSSQNNASSLSVSADVKTISDLFDFVKRYDKNFNPKPASKVVNEDGTPKVVYHGTGSDFTVFDKSKQGENYVQGEGGFFFTSSKQSATNYAKLHGGETNGKVMEEYLSIQKPYEVTAYGDYIQAPAEKYDDHRTEYLSEAELQGCDGIIVRGELSTLYVAFEPTQIKSATDNIGTFDPENPDIRYSQEPMTLKQLEAENKKLKKQLEYWRNQTKKNPKKTVREGDVKAFAKAIVESVPTDIKP